MAKGGYKVFDLNGKNIDSNGVVFPGIYEFVESATKPVMLMNLMFNGQNFGSQYVPAAPYGNSFVLFVNNTAGGDVNYLLVEEADTIKALTKSAAVA